MPNNNHNNFNVSPPLFPRINEGAYSVYLDLMKAFWQSVKRHNGSSHANETSVNHLIAVEHHIKDLFDNAPIPYELEEEFFRSAVLQSDLEFDDALPDTGDFNLLLDRITHQFNARMQHLSLDDKENEFFQTLEDGGAIIINHQDDIFVPTDPSRAHIVIGDGENNSEELHQFAPKFAEVIAALRSIGIYTNDLVIHRGVVGKNMVRNAPYHLIQIPELDAEIAVCNRIGEVILVGCPIRGAHLFKTYDKALLVKSLGVEPVRYQGDWQTRLCALVLGDQPEARENRTRPDIKSFAKSQTQPSRPKITAEMIMVEMLEYAIQSEYELPSDGTEVSCLGLYGLTWKQISNYAARNLKTSLAQIKQDYGLAIGRLNLPQPIHQAVQNYKEKGVFPEKREKPDITIEEILKAMLEYAAQSDNAVPNYYTEASCLGLHGLVWQQIASYAKYHHQISLGKIRGALVVEGTHGRGQKINTDKVIAVVSYYQQHHNISPDLLVALSKHQDGRDGEQSNVFSNPIPAP